MVDIKELEDLDVVWSMDRNIQLLLGALKDIKGAGDQEKRSVLEIVEKKIAEIEDYYYRPVDSRDLYDELSTMFEELSETGKAEDYYGRIAKMDSSLLFNKARLHNFFGNNKKAVELYKKALELMPDFVDAQKGLKTAEKRYFKSVNQLEKLEEKAEKRDDAKGYIDLGRALADVGRMMDAYDTYDMALRCDPENAEALARKGAMLQSMKKFNEAVELFQKALSIYPKSMIAKRGMNYAEYYFKNPDSDLYRE